jgi:hypothetical protein
MDRRKPDLIFIGPYKSGSEYLRGYFDEHPDIVWTRQAQFFLAAENEDHLQNYPPEVPGDAETKYFIDMFEGVAIGYVFRRNENWDVTGFEPFKLMTDDILVPNQSAVALRVHTAAPDAKILMCLRNQIDWLRSNYLHHIYYLAPQDRTFGRFLNTLEGKCAVDAGHYDRTIQAYETVFGRGRVHVMLLEEIHVNEEASLRCLCDFMGLPYIRYQRLEEKTNVGRGPLAGSAISLLSKAGLNDGQVQKIGRVLRPLAEWLNPSITHDVISMEESQLLRAVYAASNLRTAGMIGVDLAQAGYPM